MRALLVLLVLGGATVAPPRPPASLRRIEFGYATVARADAEVADTGVATMRFRPDDPVRVDPDTLPIAKPAEVEIATAFDVVHYTLRHRPDGPPPPAANVNTLGEVPDSTWFTNRLGTRAMPDEEIVRGATTVGPPDVDGPLTVIAAKSGGITPGFTMRDRRRHVYFVKFDPAAHPNLSTAADVIGSRFFHALGYHVPQNDVAYVRREQLHVDPGARISVPGGGKRTMTEADLDRSLAHAARLPDGRIRIVASLALRGEPLGPFKYFGTRPDDPNDVFPHEHRRELRGLRVFASWLNHDDSRSVNTQDMYVEGDGGRHVRHHLIDFSSIMGSGSNAAREIAPQNPRAGNEYVMERAPMLRSLFTFGIWDRPWRDVEFPQHPGVGNFEADFYHPGRWRPEYPNPAFERMRDEDAFWAAAILLEMSDEAIRAVVATGELGNAESERYLADTLIKRRDKTVRYHLARVNPLSRFEASGGALRFRNLGERAGLGTAASYDAAWSRYDNATGREEPIGAAFSAAAPEIAIPHDEAAFLVVSLRTRSHANPAWLRPVRVFLRAKDGGREVVGVERHP
jgi:hypothetical protein